MLAADCLLVKDLQRESKWERMHAYVLLETVRLCLCFCYAMSQGTGGLTEASEFKDMQHVSPIMSLHDFKEVPVDPYHVDASVHVHTC